MAVSFSLLELAKLVGGVVRGDAKRRIDGVASLDEAGPTQITWIAHEKYVSRLATSKAGAVVVTPRFGETPMPAILCDDPDWAIVQILRRFAPPLPHPPAGVHPSAVVDESVHLGQDVAVGPNVVIGRATRIGDRTVLHANVVIGPEVEIGADCVLWPAVVVRERCRLGDRVILHPHVTIGSDGYGYHLVQGRHEKIPQIGTVVIEDDVEIGAGSCVDRAKFGQTVIGEGTKIDNLVQIAHNVRIGPHCIIVAQTGIAGSTQLGRYVMLGGQVGVRDHLVLGDQVRAAACCCISKDVPAGMVVNGIPAVDNRQYLREQAQVRRLPEWAALLKDLARRVERLEAATDDTTTG